MKYVFVGDIHGKWEAVEAALKLDGKKIFVGDFIDSFDRSLEDHKKCYDLVFDAIDKGEAEAIFGNHELSYLLPNIHRCSGWNTEREMLMIHYKSRLWEKFKPFLFLNNTTLVSHAGLCQTLWRSFGLTLENVQQTLFEWWDRHNTNSPAHFIGRYRGGFKDVGGIFWCDYNVEFHPIPELSQIFGHTRGNGIRHDTNAYCIDCLDREKKFLELEI